MFRPVAQAVKSTVKLTLNAARAEGDQRQQAGVVRRVRAFGCGEKSAQLFQRIVEDVGQAVAMVDQPLDGFEPAAFTAATGARSLACANRSPIPR